MFGEMGEDLSVEGDIGFLEHGDEFGVRSAVLLEESGHADIPESAEISLFVFPVSKAISTSVENGFVGLALLGTASMTVAFNLAEDILSALESVCAFLYSCHDYL